MTKYQPTEEELAKIKAVMDSLQSICEAITDLRRNHQIAIGFGMEIREEKQVLVNFFADKIERLYIQPQGNTMQ